VDDYRKAGANALRAGFDGVELHAANGYLIDQFLRDGSNRRIDRYGGSVSNRARLLIEVTEALIAAAGAERVGVRLSPTNPFNDMADSNPAALFGYAVDELDRLRLCYLHIISPARPIRSARASGRRQFSRRWRGPLMLNKSYDLERANAAVVDGRGSGSFASLFLANPIAGAVARRPVHPPDRKTFYGETRGLWTIRLWRSGARP
jgi:N-ethylmaleimide reductase